MNLEKIKSNQKNKNKNKKVNFLRYENESIVATVRVPSCTERNR